MIQFNLAAGLHSLSHCCLNLKYSDCTQKEKYTVKSIIFFLIKLPSALSAHYRFVKLFTMWCFYQSVLQDLDFVPSSGHHQMPLTYRLNQYSWVWSMKMPGKT